MQNHTTIATLRNAIREARRGNRTIGLVPTMGNLHAGHLKLVKEARRCCDWLVCTVFVNPLQFGANEDLDSYPRTLADDRAKLQEYQCDCLFHPDPTEIYPRGLSGQTRVTVPELGIAHCGQSRPGHFEGVATVVCKLFNICQPDQAFFGLKDYQQYLILRRMADDLQFPIQITGVETEREADGLAMSSRNNYLSEAERSRAPLLYRTLTDAADHLRAGDRNFQQLEQSAIRALREAGLTVDYLTICNSTTLRPAVQEDRELVILAAVYLGKTRLIDNIRLAIP
jgi:pantoate--beta-alanine ligase